MIESVTQMKELLKWLNKREFNAHWQMVKATKHGDALSKNYWYGAKKAIASTSMKLEEELAILEEVEAQTFTW